MVKCGVLFEVRTEFLTIIKTSIGFKGLKRDGWSKTEHDKSWTDRRGYQR
jgi:hypothetical protein